MFFVNDTLLIPNRSLSCNRGNTSTPFFTFSNRALPNFGLSIICKFLTGRWFSPGTPVSSTNKSDRYDITEILLKVALNTINQSTYIWKFKTSTYTIHILYLYANDCTFLKLSVVEREIHNIVLVKFHVWWRKTSNSPHFISTSISVCNAQSFADDLSKSHNLKASPFRAIGVLKVTIEKIG
jgi:hypothetical protein